MLALIGLSIAALPVLLVLGRIQLRPLLARALDWAVTNRILLAPATDPLLAVPMTDGAGLDLTRAVTAGGVVLLLLILLVTVTRTGLRQRRRQQEMA